MLKLDHLVVADRFLDAAAAHVETELGVVMQPGGLHPRYGTHNRLMGLGGGHYLEAIGIDPAATPPADARWFGLDNPPSQPKLLTWVCRVDDLDAAIARLPMAGQAVDLTRDHLRWRIAVPPNGQMPFDGVFPALIDWGTSVAPGSSLPSSGVKLREIRLEHPEINRLQGLLDSILEVPEVRFVAAETPRVTACFATPQGDVWLT
ncbi:VOC family protein [Pseudoprimorskyibacter insulae]|uniref:Glyoxalase-like domain-containing protein n=1 Tax=Pseudoprimorskyibacter insulae TaxID=1695997 RepID=A0A2R8AQV3_9RHOB|nr:VOC family protein [Pseudoprimorskyibacter insulae]SPF78433.1 hypothetical protein PRI8871_01036 [Pseudoprimorskyibacter insulae]